MTGARHSWEYPECPECETDVLVRSTPSSAGEAWVCEGCGERFS